MTLRPALLFTLVSLASALAVAQEAPPPAPEPAPAPAPEAPPAATDDAAAAPAEDASAAPADAQPEDAAPADAQPADAQPADAQPADAQPADAQGEPVPVPADPAMGSLSISSSPSGAQIFIDGKDTGKTTPAVDLQVAPGTHELKVVLDGREKSVSFHLDAGGLLNLNLNLPEEPAVAQTTPGEGDGDSETPADGAAADVAATSGSDWTWMTVTGWAGLGLGTLGLIAGAVVLTTPYDPDQGPLGFGLFGTGAGLVLGGAVLLYLDNELSEEKPAAEGIEQPAVSALPVFPLVAAQ